MDFYTVDRFEGELAVCEQEDGRFVQLPRADLPAGVKEGDVLTRSPQGVFAVAKDETARRRADAYAKQQALFKRSK